MTRAILFALLLVGACDAEGATDPARNDGPGFRAAARALDGDTLAADFRLLGVDAFESRQMCEKAGSCWPCGKFAQDLAAKLLKGSEAEIRLTNTRSYGRPVAVVTIDGQDLGEALIRAGLAIPQPQFLKGDPDRENRYDSAYVLALNARAGAHAGSWLPPAEWRRGRRLQCERR